jgi:hypothetical protein
VWVLCALAVSLAPATAFAQLPVARLHSVFPPGGRAGSSVEVTLTGQDLDDAKELRFSHPGIKAEAAGGGKFKVDIAEDVPVGAYDARAVGRFGISNPRAFSVGGLPEVMGADGAQSSSSPQEIALGVVVNARCPANGANHYAVTLKKQLRVLVECAAREIDSKMSPVLALYDVSGREVERSRRGGLLDFTPPDDGRYTLRVHDLTFRGGPDYFYRLSVGTGPRLDFVFPPAGSAGSKSGFTLYGRNLPGGSRSSFTAADGKPLDELKVEIELPEEGAARLQQTSLVGPAGATTDGFEYRLRADTAVSNPVLLTYARAPMIVEQEGDGAAAVTPPCEYAGRFFPRGDRDAVTFEAKKGEAYWIEIFSERLGLPTDPLLVVQRVKKDEKGQEQAADVEEVYDQETNLGGPGFRTSSRDPALRLEVKEDGLYRVLVRDLFNTSRDNPALAYRLLIRPEPKGESQKKQPDFRLVALPVGQGSGTGANDATAAGAVWTPFLRKGGVAPVRVLVFRQNGFTGDVNVAIEGLPEGVKCDGVVVPGGEASASLMLRAEEKAEGWAGTLRIVGKAHTGTKELVRPARYGAVTWGPSSAGAAATEPILSRLTADFALAVSGEELEPVSIETGDGKVIEAKPGDKLKIPIKVTRRAEVKAALKLKAAGLDALKNVKELTVDPKAEAATLELDLAQQKLAPGTYTFHLQAQAQVKYARPSGGASDEKDKKGGESKKKEAAKDVQATFYSMPVTLKILGPAGPA